MSRASFEAPDKVFACLLQIVQYMDVFSQASSGTRCEASL